MGNSGAYFLGLLGVISVMGALSCDHLALVIWFCHGDPVSRYFMGGLAALAKW